MKVLIYIVNFMLINFISSYSCILDLLEYLL